MHIALVSDELSADPETAVELAAGWGIRHFELRGFFADRVPNYSRYQKQQLRLVLDDYDAQVVALSPGLFKMPYPAAKPYRWSFTVLDALAYQAWDEALRLVQTHLNEILPAALDYASELGVRTIVTFGFSRGGLPPGAPPDGVIEVLWRAAERAAAHDIILAVETEDGFWPDTGAHTAALIRAVNHPALRVNWDPGNSFCAGDVPYPDGYAAVRGLVQHVHFKDAYRLPDGGADFTLDGQIDWAGQINALRADKYEGYISIETHLRPKIAAARATFDRLRALIGSNAD